MHATLKRRLFDLHLHLSAAIYLRWTVIWIGRSPLLLVALSSIIACVGWPGPSSPALLLWGPVERLDGRWQGPTPPPAMNGGWCHLRFWQAPVRVYTKEALASEVELWGLLLILESTWHVLKVGGMDLCPGWYYLSPHLTKGNTTKCFDRLGLKCNPKFFI